MARKKTPGKLFSTTQLNNISHFHELWIEQQNLSGANFRDWRESCKHMYQRGHKNVPTRGENPLVADTYFPQFPMVNTEINRPIVSHIGWWPGTESNCRHGDFQFQRLFYSLLIINNLQRLSAPIVPDNSSK
ncbi:MAG: hypothetical protein ACI8P9_003560 [Parasphingorhabdus sp.]|jgi:hypothetical protein